MKKVLFILFVLISIKGVSQNQTFSLGIWHLDKFSGQAEMKGLYRVLDNYYNDFHEKQSSMHLLGSLQLDTKNYLWDPKFLTINIGAEYSPETKKENFIVIPNQSEIHTLKKLDIRTTLLKDKNISLNTFSSFNQNYFNRETITNVKSDRILWGGRLSFRNKIAPLSLSFRQNLNDQEETETGRKFGMDQTNIEGRATTSFFNRDKHEIVYSHNIYSYSNSDSDGINNTTDNLKLFNQIAIDSLKKYKFRSSVFYTNQHGNTNFTRLNINENLRLELPLRFIFSTNYNYVYFEQESTISKHQRVKAKLDHKLYFSLNTGVYYEYSKLEHTLYDETNSRGGINIYYTKKIPLKGRLTLNYINELHNNSIASAPTILQILNEEQLLSDGEIVMLNRAYVDPLSVIVKDETGTIIYQLNFDYRIIEREYFIEIQRIPAGQIENNTNVYIDYISNQPGNYSYLANTNNFSASIAVFSNLFEIYYKWSDHQYINIDQKDFLPVNDFTQTVLGSRIDLGFLRTGIEYDQFNSNIVPYKMIRIYANAQKVFYNKLLFSLNGNYRNYNLTQNDVYQLYADISGKLAYKITPQMEVSLDAGYRNHIGENIDLTLFTAKTEFSTKIHQLYVKVGLETYQRLYVNDKVYLKGAYFKIIRKF